MSLRYATFRDLTKQSAWHGCRITYI